MKEEEMVTSTPESTNETTDTTVATPEVQQETVEPTVEAPVGQPEVSPVETTNEVEMQTPAETAPVAPTEESVEAPVTTPDTTSLAPEAPETPIGETTAPVTLEAPADPTAKKSKKGLIIAIVAIVLVLAILGIAFYVTQFKSGNKRLETIVDSLFDNATYTETVKKIKKQQSGTYSVSASADLKQDSSSLFSGSVEFNGNYGIDVDKKNAYATLSLENLVYNKSSLLGATGLNATAELDDQTLYLGVTELFDKVIKQDSEDFAETWEELKKLFEETNNKENVDVQLIINGIEAATKASVNAVDVTQTVKSVDGIGNVNVVTIKLDKTNAVKMSNAFRDSILNNQELIKELATLSDEKEEDIKEMVKDMFDEESISSDLNETIEVYTALLGNELKGFRVEYVNETSEYSCTSGTTDVVTVLKDGDKYKVKVNAPKSMTADLEITATLGDTTTLAVTGTINIISNESDYSNGKTICTESSKTAVKVDVKYTFANDFTSKQSMKLEGKVEAANNCSKESYYCENTTYEASFNLSEQITIDATYKTSSIDKDKAVDASELTEQDSVTIVTNAQNNLGYLGTIIYNYLVGESSSDDYYYSSEY